LNTEQLQEFEFMNCVNKECLEDDEVDKVFKVVKPDITFFGEQLPDLFMKSYQQDLSNCDLLIVMVIT
jgi:NAD-dependent SIR2 family protein deacetylase